MTAALLEDDELTIGELFAGYGGLGMGVQAAIGGRVVWVSEFDDAPSRILAHRLPGVPNYGDITKIKWTPDCPTCGELTALYYNDEMPEGRGYYCPSDGWFDLGIRLADPDAARIPEPVDVITGGSPCQDLSNAGARKGMTEGTRSNLWVEMREAIAVLRPRYVVWENVRGAYSAQAASHLESDAGLLAGVRRRRGQPVLRALGRVVGDLSDLGYDCRWHGLRAADVGAPHGRFRVFVVATDTRSEERDRWPRLRPAGARFGRGRPGHGGREADGPAGGGLNLPTPSARDYKDHTIRQEPHRPGDVDTLARALATVPAGQDSLLPTPRTSDGEKGGPNQRGSSGDLMLPSAVMQDALLLGTPRATRGGSTTETLEKLFPTPGASDGEGGKTARGGDRSDEPLLGGIAKLLPTPAVNDMGEGKTVEWWDEWAPRQKAADGRPAPHGKSLNIEAQRLLPTPQAHDAKGPKSAEQVAAMRAEGHGVANLNEEVIHSLPQRLLPTPTCTDAAAAGAPEGNEYRGVSLTDATVRQPHKWGAYAAAVARWEAISGEVAPDPTEVSPTGTVRLAAAFSEWMMGLPPGWVTDPSVWEGLTNKKGRVLEGARLINARRNHQLKALGNGVVPAQAEAALRLLLDPDLLSHPLPVAAPLADVDEAEPQESW